MNKKITLPELVDALSETTGMQKKICESFVKDLIDVLQNALLNNENVKIAGLGTFKCVEVDARKSIDVNSGEEIEIPSYRKVVLTVDKSMAQAVNSAFAEFETVELEDSITDDMLLIENEPESEQQLEPLTQVVVSSENIAENKEVAIEPVVEPEAEVEEVVVAKDETETVVEVENNNTLVENNPVVEDSVESPDIETKVSSPIIGTTDEKEDEYNEISSVTNDRSSFKRGIIWGIISGFVIAMIIMLAAFLFIGDKFSFVSNQEPTNNDTELVIDNDVIESDTIAPFDENTDNFEPEIITKVKTDTVGRTRFLTTMAREYYGNFNFWVYIYLENKDIIDNPNKIKPGTIVVIPDADKYGIDNGDTSIEKARKLAAEINRQFD